MKIENHMEMIAHVAVEDKVEIICENPLFLEYLAQFDEFVIK